MSGIDVTVVTPAYNAADTLEETYRSIVRQGDCSWELLLVDNGSTDGTSELARSLASQDERIRAVTEERRGVWNARNLGIELARGEFIAFLDADDVLGPRSLDARIRALRANPEHDLAYCSAHYVGPNLEPLDWVYTNKEVVTFADAHGSPCAVGSALLGRSTLIKQHRFPPKPNGEDWLFIARLLRTGATMIRADDVHVLYRQSPSSAVQSEILNHERACLEVLDLVYGLDGEVISADEWREGLSDPPVSIVKGRRLLRLVVYLLMARDEEQANIAIGLLEKSDAVDGSIGDATGAIEVAVSRALFIPRGSGPAAWYTTLTDMLKTASAVQLPSRVPRLWAALSDLGASVGARSGPSGGGCSTELDAFPDGPFADGFSLDAGKLAASYATSLPGVQNDALIAGASSAIAHLSQRGWRVRATIPNDAERARVFAQVEPSWNLRIDLRPSAARSNPVGEGHPHETVSLQRLASEQYLSEPALLWIGSAAVSCSDTLAGYPLDDHSPDLIAIEVGQRFGGRESLSAVLDLLDQAGYSVLIAETSTAATGRSHFRGIRSARGSLAGGTGEGVLLAVPNEANDRFRSWLTTIEPGLFVARISSSSRDIQESP